MLILTVFPAKVSFERKLQLVQELRDMLTLAGKTVKMSIC